MLLLGILIYVVLFVGLIALIVKVAPFGYEDENGFHLVKDQINHEKSVLNKKFVGISNRAA